MSRSIRPEPAMATTGPLRPRRTAPVVTLTLAAALLALGAPGLPARGAAAPSAPDPGGARGAFLEAYRVFTHPRCINCHPAGDAPLQGDDGRPHGQNVTRGPDGKGRGPLKCANCHQEANLPGENMPPGNPGWHLPPPATPMVFESRSPGDLARQLKDPGRTGGRTLAQLLRHVEEDPLVLWGWDPGDGRTPPPLTHAEFVARMKEWIDKGADAPE